MSRGRTGLLTVSLALAVICTTPDARADDPPIVRIGIIVDGPWVGNDEVLELTVREIRSLTEGEFDVRFPELLVGEWSLESAQANLRQLLDDPAIDLVITWGILSSHAVCCEPELSKPVIAPVVIDPELQGLPQEDGTSGVHNLSYVTLPATLRRELRRFREIVPFNKVALLANGAFFRAIPQLLELTRRELQGTGIDFHYVPVGSSADEALAAIAGDVDAVYLWPQFHLPRAEWQRLLDGLIERRLPSFSALGRSEVEAGLLASYSAPDFFPRMARRIALNAQRILLGEEPGSIPVAFAPSEELLINMAVARAIRVSPRWDALIEAELIQDVEQLDLPVLSFDQAVTEAVAANLELAVEQRNVTAAGEDVRRARAPFRPQADWDATTVLIDEDRAAASFGSQAERTTATSATVSQLLFSDQARANITVRQELQTGRERGVDSLRLNIAFDAAVAYLDLLRAKTAVQIQRNNLALTRSNLALARSRRTVGVANPAEVFRWESQIATDRKSLVEALAQQEVARVAVNRILHRPLQQRFLPTEVGLDDPTLITSEARFQSYIQTPRQFEVLQNFAVVEGQLRSPELRQLEASIRAQERVLRAARRSYWAPTIALQGSATERLSQGGAGTDNGALGPLPFDTTDDTDWSVALSMSLPLWQGGARKADRLQADEQLDALRVQYDAVAERIEQNIRSTMLVARASYTGIRLSREAAEAASKNLELVSDSYARGAVSIIDLLDAQNASLNAEQVAANAVYDFLIDLMQVQRAVSRFDFFTSPAAREDWYRRLDAFFADAGVAPYEP